MAVKITEVPEQTLFWFTPIDTLATITGLTTIVTEFEVARVLETQGAFEVKTQVTISPLTGV